MENSTKEKSGWNSPAGYIWAMIGSAVGFANILGFGAKCYKSGGGAFLIPLGISVIVLGVPMLVLEGTVGKTFKEPLVTSYARIAGTFGRFLAWPTIFGVITIGGYYCVLNAWSLIYMFYAATDQIPADTKTFFSESFLHSTSSLIEFGQFSWLIALTSMAVFLLSFFINESAISRGIELLCKYFLPLLFLILAGLLVAVFQLEGATDGMLMFITPKWETLSEPSIWISSFGHVFFSFSIGLGIIIGYSRYTSQEVNIVRSMIWVACGDMITSLISGFIIFGGIGYMALKTGQSFDSFAGESTFGLGFVVFPQVLHTFSSGISMIVGALFFFSLFIAGISGLISIIEAAAGNFTSEFGWSRKRSVGFSICIMAIFSIIFSFGNSGALIGTVDAMTAGVNVLAAGLLQILLFMYVSKDIGKSSEWYMGEKKAFYFYALKYLSPLILIVILYRHIADEFSGDLDAGFWVRWGWFFMALVLSLVLSMSKKTQADNLL